VRSATRTASCVVAISLLCLLVCALPAAADPEPWPFVPGSWTLVLLPDTQFYAQDHPDIFTAQTRWIVENRDARRIRFVLHEGDVTNDNSPGQWGNARYSMSLLDGVVPYALVPGNHDGGYARDSLLSVFFPVALFQRAPTFGGVFETGKLDNSYHLFTAGGREWLILALEWEPREEVVAWADRVLKKYPERSAMILTHAYLNYDDTLLDQAAHQLWDTLIAPNRNVAFVFSGHVCDDGAGRLRSTGRNGNTVEQIVANYQMRAEGGEGYLRLMEFRPDGKTVQVKTYSPYLGKYLTDEQQQFTLEVPPPVPNRP
jgi:3',5'-cyclic AMP phosphodiesterase CpdA